MICVRSHTLNYGKLARIPTPQHAGQKLGAWVLWKQNFLVSPENLFARELIKKSLSEIRIAEKPVSYFYPHPVRLSCDLAYGILSRIKVSAVSISRSPRPILSLLYPIRDDEDEPSFAPGSTPPAWKYQSRYVASRAVSPHWQTSTRRPSPVTTATTVSLHPLREYSRVTVSCIYVNCLDQRTRERGIKMYALATTAYENAVFCYVQITLK